MSIERSGEESIISSDSSKKGDEIQPDAESSEEEDTQIPEESKISKTLSDKTIKTVVMLVLFLLFMLAICSSDTYIEGDNLHNQGL